MMNIKHLAPLAVAALATISTPAAAAVKIFDFSGTFNGQSATGFISYDTDASPSGGQTFPNGSIQEFYTTGIELNINGFSYSNVYVNYIRGYYDPTTDYFSINGSVGTGGDAFGNSAGEGVVIATRLPSGPARSLPADLSGRVFTGGAGISGSVIVNATGAVPEPSTWAMMIAGFGLVGGAMRRKRVAVSFA